jgi:hypothetical protein
VSTPGERDHAGRARPRRERVAVGRARPRRERVAAGRARPHRERVAAGRALPCRESAPPPGEIAAAGRLRRRQGIASLRLQSIRVRLSAGDRFNLGRTETRRGGFRNISKEVGGPNRRKSRSGQLIWLNSVKFD